MDRCCNGLSRPDDLTDQRRRIVSRGRHGNGDAIPGIVVFVGCLSVYGKGLAAVHGRLDRHGNRRKEIYLYGKDLGRGRALGPWTKTLDTNVSEKTTCDLVTTGSPQRSVGTCRMAETYEEVHGERNKGNTSCPAKPGTTESSVAAVDKYSEMCQTAGGIGQMGAVVMMHGDQVTVNVNPIQFNTLVRNSQKVVSGCGPVDWGPFYGNFENETLAPRLLGGVEFDIKLGQLKGSRSETPSEGTVVTYTWDLKPCGAK